MNPSVRKAGRLQQIEALLLAHPEGLTQAEIARRLSVNRSTINRYVADLPAQIYVDDLDGGRWKLDRSADLIHVHLNLHEATAVHLASRLLATCIDRQNPHAAAALRKMAVALERLAPHICQHIAQSADAIDEESRWNDQGFLRSLEVITLAWGAARKVKLWYRARVNEPVKETIFSPYFIEPGAVGRSTYVIGFSELHNALRTLKIERIERVEALREAYTIPADFNPRELLRYAWGIWYTDEEPVEVVLKFSARVAQRLGETRWHCTEQVEPLADGSLLWRAKIAEPQEMMPWIRGWGADVEVLEPERLRKALEKEIQRLAKVYGVEQVKNSNQQYYAHTKDIADESEWQLLKDHLIETANKAFELGSDAGISELARTAGLLHDLGKYSEEFQARLHGSNKLVDHATAGAREVMKLFPESLQRDFAELLSYCIAGHHSGLPNYGSKIDVETDGTLLARREKKNIKDYNAYKQELDTTSLQIIPQHPIKSATFRWDGKERSHKWFSISFFTRMLFSILTDADWLDTERFVQGDMGRGQHASIEELTQQFNTFLACFDNPTTEINRKRTETLLACIEKSDQEPGFFKLTVPTGGGKTFASMAFALNHAKKNGLKRIIYVIPFTSIIEQNANEFRKALGALGQENILEHHSNFDWEGKKKKKTEEEFNDETHKFHEKLKLAAENWDVPIVVTTNVQFFESLFSNKKRSARKLHNIAKSVIIFDETQMLPREYLKPSLLAVQDLVNNYGATAVFCTATQPSLERFFPEKTHFTELAPDPQALFDFYRRIDVKNLGTQEDEDIIEKLNLHKQVLCIVNTRRHAKGLYKKLDSKEDSFHLSTVMCPVHRKEILKEIRQRLKDELPCRVVSTQVMEAGIDVDFPVGYRAFAGLDSIIQAAGRVNREGKRTRGDVFVFKPKTEFIKRTPLFIAQTSAVAESALRNFADDPTSISAIESYYETLYTLQRGESFDVKNIIGYFEKGTGKPDFDFQKASENFKFIEDISVSVIIPFNDEAKMLIEKLKYVEFPAKTVRALQPYTVNIYEGEFMNIQGKGVIHTIGERYHVLDAGRMAEFYDPKTGLTLPERGSGEAIFYD